MFSECAQLVGKTVAQAHQKRKNEDEYAKLKKEEQDKRKKTYKRCAFGSSNSTSSSEDPAVLLQTLEVCRDSLHPQSLQARSRGCPDNAVRIPNQQVSLHLLYGQAHRHKLS